MVHPLLSKPSTRWRFVRMALVIVVATVALIPVVVLGGLTVGFDDPGRGQLATTIMNRVLPGSFVIEAVGLSWPLKVDIRGVTIKTPEGKTVARAARVEASVQVTALLQRTLLIHDITVESPRVDIVKPPGDGDVTIATAFATPNPNDKGKPGDGPPLRIDLRDVTVRDAQLNVNTPEVQIAARNLEIRDAGYFIDRQDMGLAVDLHVATTLRSAAINLDFKQLAIKVRNAVYHFETDNKRVSTDSVALNTPGLAFDLNGYFTATETAITGADAGGTLRVDVGFAPLQALLPPALVKTLHGAMAGRVRVETRGPRRTAKLDFDGNKLTWRHLKLEHIGVGVSLKGQQLQVDGTQVRFSVRDDESGKNVTAKVDIKGTLALFPDAKTAVGEHDLQVTVTDLPLQLAMGPLVDKPGLLPKTANLNLHTVGRSLWPMTSVVDLEATAHGVPASWIPGIPDPFVLHGKLLTHPDAIEVMRLQFGSESSKLGLQGIIKFNRLGLLDIVKNLHTYHDHVGPAPKP